ncbi:hypothetical protein P7C71_g5862, partial [Lecanoromycetidae sp. Uapishka_2]
MPSGDEQPRKDSLASEVVPINNEIEQSHDISEEVDEAAAEEAREKLRREREARAQALTLEIVGDLPYAEVKPPENVLFVCKLNPVTEDEDLDTIFSRFGSIVSCEVIRDKRTRDSLQYAFIEFENQKDCEQALSDKWRTATNSKRAQNGGGFGGISSLEKRRQFRAAEPKDEEERKRYNGYGMVFDKDAVRDGRDGAERTNESHRSARSRSPGRSEKRRQRTPPKDAWRRRDRSRDTRRDDYDNRRRRR